MPIGACNPMVCPIPVVKASVPAPAEAAPAELKPRRSRKKKTAAERREALAKLGIDVELDPEAMPDASAEPPLPAIAVELGLTATDLPTYQSLWAVSGAVGGVLQAQAAFGFFTMSGLDMATLRQMWNVAHSEVEHPERGYIRGCDTRALRG